MEQEYDQEFNINDKFRNHNYIKINNKFKYYNHTKNENIIKNKDLNHDKK